MVISPLASPLYETLFGDPAINQLLSEQNLLQEMVRFEQCLARVQADLGIIPKASLAPIETALADFNVDLPQLASATDAAGVVSPGLVVQLRAHIGAEAGGYLHYGATSQDVLDTAVVLVLKQVFEQLDENIQRLFTSLADLARAHRHTLHVGRTRGQQAAPTSFGLKVAGWAAPLRRHKEKWHTQKTQWLCLAFAGAVGNLSALAQRGEEVEARLAAELDIAIADGPWHSARDRMIEMGGWATSVSVSLGKIAQDVLLMSASEVGELREGGEGRGGSSTMPNKSNPVRSEAIVSLARHTAGLIGSLYQTGLHAHERDGVSWQQEWLVLPQILSATGGALKQAQALIDGLIVDRERMRANFEASRGLPCAELSAFALAAHMPLPDAQALIKAACKQVLASDRHLFDILAEETTAPVDWQKLRQPEHILGMNDPFIDRLLGVTH